ncbi:MAG: glycosyltransferase family 2 protein [bacterium]|nr:glycosyltransferase family 2 protein [bacterium]
MIHEKRVSVVLPAFNAELTLERTVAEIPHEFVDDLILVDDASSDRTCEVAYDLGLHVVSHETNQGYGANQKTCYRKALERGADVVVMLHPDYQYTPKLLTAMASLVAIEQYDVVLGSRILSRGALRGGMPMYKYVANRALTLFQNFLLNEKLSEYHTGYRAFSRRVLEQLPLSENSNGFVFDNQMLAQALYFGFEVGEISCPAKYFPEASEISLLPSIRYGFGVLATSVAYRSARFRIRQSRIFSASGRRLNGNL